MQSDCNLIARGVHHRRQKRLIFQVCTSKMNLSDDVDLEDYVSRPDKISGAEIAAICQEAGMHGAVAASELARVVA